MNWANGLYDVHFYGERNKVNYYVQYSERREGEEPAPVIQCQQTLDWMQVILISVGCGCGLFAIGFIVYFVVVNLKDYMELREFKKKQKNIWESDGVVEPEMRKSEKRKSVRKSLTFKFPK